MDLDVLAEVSYDDLKEMGIREVGPRHKVAKHIATFAEAKGKAKMALSADKKAVALAAAQVYYSNAAHGTAPPLRTRTRARTGRPPSRP